MASSLPQEILLRMPKAIQDRAPGENHVFTLLNSLGHRVASLRNPQANTFFELSKGHPLSYLIANRPGLRNILLDGVDVRWGKKCIGYEETQDGVWALFGDG